MVKGTLKNETCQDEDYDVTTQWPLDLADTALNYDAPRDERSLVHVEGKVTGPDSPEGCDGQCDLCGSLNIKCLVSDYGPEGKMLDLEALIDAASRCKTCEMIFNLWGLRKFTDVQFNNSVRVRFKTRPRVDGCCGVLVVEAVDHTHLNINRLVIIAKFTAFTNEDDVASSKYGLLPLHTVGTNTSSVESFNIARKWLKNCIEGHQGRNRTLRAGCFRREFGESRFDEEVGPARLIDVFAHERYTWSKGCGSKASSALYSGDLSGDEYPRGQKGLSRIVDRVDVMGRPYLALSYTWGSQSPHDYTTTHDNISARKLDIAERELPKTFQHAIYIARRLNVRYLWIDAICIIQGPDGGDDWREESGKMGSIYANALLTLVAAAGNDSEEGMFNKRSTYGHMADNKVIAIRTVLPDSAVCSTLYFVPSDMTSEHLGFRPHKYGGPLLSRAWCLQEDLLSMRKLYYASDQLYWECDHLAVSEDGLANPLPSSLKARKSSESLLAWHASCAWYNQVIGHAYSMRVATKVTDRLIAVAGLARHVADTVKSRYLAGLWEVSILQGLLWQADSQTEEGTKTYCAPSWSWASQEVGTTWESLKKSQKDIVPGCEYLRAHINLLSNDLYGGVVSGTLTLRSKVVEVVVGVEDRHRGSEVLQVASYGGVRGWARLDERISLSDKRFFAIAILDDVSLLVTRGSESDTYRRAGIWRIANKYDGRGGVSELPTWDIPAEYLRWRDQILPTIPMTEITIV